MFSAAFLSMKEDSLTFDELAHIGAGYSYLTQKDYRLNPEHPPLIKDLAALPLLFLNLNFPSENQNWVQKENPQWWVQFNFGRDFIFRSGNNPQKIIFFARLPMLFVLMLLGWMLFKWAKELGGNWMSLAVLFLFSFSPTFIAMGRLVTTDVGASLGAVLSTYFWLKLLKSQKKINIVLAGLSFGIAMLLKFSLVLLIPFFATITVLYPIVFSKKLRRHLFLGITAVLIGTIFVIWPVYSFHTANYPPEKQLSDTKFHLAPNPLTPVKNLTVWMADKPILRPLGQYLKGALMAVQRVGFGNTVYFLGNISSSGWHYYFPIIYLLKIPLALHFLSVLAIIGFLWKAKLKDWLKDNFDIFALFLFIVIYWLVALSGNLNIGIRHLLPTLPFVYMLAIFGIKKLYSKISFSLKPAFLLLVVSLFGWYSFSSVKAFPDYIPYYNELAGGTKNGYKIAVDSNYDWGQDFKKLVKFVEENNIKEMRLDYFGGEDPEYYLGAKYKKLDPKDLEETPKGWIAISITQFQNSSYYQSWLKNHDPVAKAGNSIIIYYIQE
ncbi:MAG: glycosyltransferase family 39 protein [Candidatus Nealsonbacteria bacterium]|nr:glycosyltransferase family 39 protein [Candidatus Nealsonbacteria bacterium]